jgi:hypothetical protein
MTADEIHEYIVDALTDLSTGATTVDAIRDELNHVRQRVVDEETIGMLVICDDPDERRAIAQRYDEGVDALVLAWDLLVRTIRRQ